MCGILVYLLSFPLGYLIFLFREREAKQQEREAKQAARAAEEKRLRKEKPLDGEKDEDDGEVRCVLRGIGLYTGGGRNPPR